VLAHYVLSHLLSVITAVATTLMVVRLLSTDRTPQSLVAWMLGLTFVPLAAIPLYFLIGTRKLPRRAKRGMFAIADPQARAPIPRHLTLPVAKCTHPVARVLRDLGAPPPRDCHRFELLEDGERAYAGLMALIAGAQRSIELTLFILGDDAVGWSVVGALAERAKAGVRVRVILDAVGSAKIARKAARQIHAAGGSVREFMPLIHAPLRGRNNLRCHRKLALVDDERVFLGGMNVAGEYMGPTPLAGRWRDLAGIVSGPVAADAGAVFESDWAFCGGSSEGAGEPATARPVAPPRTDPHPAPPTGDATVELVPSGPDMAEDTFYNAVLTAIFVATERVAIVTPYYVPDDVVQRALVLTARRGVRTQLVMPARSNHALADFARRSLLRELASAGVELHFYPRGMVHAKAMVVDDAFAYIGSPNMDMRSFFLNYEDALCIYSAPHVAMVRAWVDGLLAECTTEPPTTKRAYWLFEQVARMVAPEL
jgi:cardiolipin synthase